MVGLEGGELVGTPYIKGYKSIQLYTSEVVTAGGGGGDVLCLCVA